MDATVELERAYLIIDYLYGALGPAADDIMDWANDYADEQMKIKCEDCGDLGHNRVHYDRT